VPLCQKKGGQRGPDGGQEKGASAIAKKVVTFGSPESEIGTHKAKGKKTSGTDWKSIGNCLRGPKAAMAEQQDGELQTELATTERVTTTNSTDRSERDLDDTEAGNQ